MVTGIAGEREGRAWRRYSLLLALYRTSFAGLLVVFVMALCGFTDVGDVVFVVLALLAVSALIVAAYTCPACGLPIWGPRYFIGGYDVRRNEFGNRCYHCGTWRPRLFARRAEQPRA
jgi:hypothetical protein